MESMADNSNRKDQLIRQHTIKVDRQQNHEEMDKDWRPVLLSHFTFVDPQSSIPAHDEAK